MKTKSKMSTNADYKTQLYFNHNTPEYRPNLYYPIVEWLNNNSNSSQLLVDIGCGSGNILSLIKRKTPICQLFGVDITQNYLDQTKKRVGCKTLLGSVLDSDFCEGIKEKFDYVLMGSVLHHLVGKTRNLSFRNALFAVANTTKMLKKGGHLLIFEPAHYPRVMMWWVFWIKKCVSTVASNRVEIGKRWMNLGLPVVNYFTNEQLVELIKKIDDVSIIDAQYNDAKALGMGIHRTSSTFIVRKNGY